MQFRVSPSRQEASSPFAAIRRPAYDLDGAIKKAKEFAGEGAREVIITDIKTGESWDAQTFARMHGYF